MTPDDFELSPRQESMLQRHLRAPGSGEHHGQVVVELAEDLDVARLEQAWRHAAARHAALRTTFRWESLDGACHRVHASTALPIQRHDWTTMEPDAHASRLGALLAADRADGFDFALGPLVRVALVRAGAARWWMLVSFPHVVLDATSAAVVIAEVFRAYDAPGTGGLAESAAPVAFGAYIAWLRTRDTEEDERFWRATLRGVLAPTPLPGGAPSRDGMGSSVIERQLDASTSATLRMAATNAEVGMSTIAMGAWMLLLARHAATAEVTCGVACPGRHGVPGGAQMVGSFATVLPLRMRVRRDLPVREWMRVLQVAQRALGPHEHARLADVRRWSGLASGLPLFESVVAYEDVSFDGRLRAQSGSRASRSARLHDRASAPLELQVTGEAQLRLRLTYDLSRYDVSSALALADELAVLLAALPALLDERVATLCPASATRAASVPTWAPAVPSPASPQTTVSSAFRA